MPIQPDFPRNALAVAMLAALLPTAAQAQFAATIQLSSLDGSDGFALDGVATDDHSGRAVSGAGDINGDGIDDLLIGAYRADPNGDRSGQSYVVFGRRTPAAAPIPTSAALLAAGLGLRTPLRRRRRNQEAGEHDAWFHRQVQIGLDSANVGDLVAAEEVEAKAAAWRAETRRKLVGSVS